MKLGRHRIIARRLRTVFLFVTLILLSFHVGTAAQVVRVGFYENAPKLYTNESGRIVGFFPEVIEHIAEQEGWGLEYVSGTWSECLSRLEAGEIDLMPDVGYSEQRAAVYGFAEEPLFINWGIIYTIPDSEIESIPDLVGKRIAVMKGSIHTEGEQGIKAMLSQFDIQSTYVEVSNYTEVFEVLQAGEADAGAVNRLFGLANEDQYGVRPTPIVFNPRELRFAYTMGSEFGQQLAERIDVNVRSMKANHDSIYYRSIETYLLGATPDFLQRLPNWLPWLLGGGGAVILLSALAILILRRRQRYLSTELAASEIQFETMFEKAAVGIVVLRPIEGTFLRANPRFCEMMGYTEVELQRIHVSAIFHPEDPGLQAPAVQDVVEGRSARLVSEERLVRKDGSILWGAITRSMVKSPSGEPIYGIGIIQDITERRQAEGALKESEERLRSIIEQSIDGIALVDSEGFIIEWNRGQVEITGIPMEQAVGRPFWDVQFETVPQMKRAPQLLDILREAALSMLRGEESPWAGRFLDQEIQRPDGDLRMIQIGSFPIDLGERRMLGSVTRDISEQKRAEEELETHRENLEQLVAERTEALNTAIEAANAAMFRHDLITGEVERDERWFDIAGITADEFDGTHETWRRLVHPDDIVLAESRIDSALKCAADSLRQEYRIVRPDGLIKYIESRSRILRDEDGRPITHVGMNIDITERRKAEDAIRERDAFLRSIIEHMPIDFFAIDKDMRYTMQSPSSKAAVGDVIGKRADELDVDEALQEEWMSELHDVLSGATSQREYDVPLATGETKTFISSMAPVRVAGEIVAAIGTSLDITDRKRSEERIRQLSRVIEESPVSVVITDTEGSIEYVNPRFSEVTGYGLEEAAGENPRILKSGHQPTEYYKELWETIIAGRNWRGEFCNRKKSGDLFWELASISPIRDENDVITHFVAIKEDITERKHAAWDLEQTKRDAESANQAKSDFLANMSHELRTPLNAVIGFSEVLEDGTFGELNEKQTQYVGNILQSGRHLLSLINDILDLSKVEAGKMELDLSSVDASLLIFESLIFVQEKAHQHGIRLETDLPEDVRALTIQADERKLKQIMFNLLSNATKFTPDGGSITLSAELGDGELFIRVQDTGIGLKPEDLRRVFDEFEQIDSSYAKAQQGTGLGLALTKRLIELHGGRIWAESEGEGTGSTFTFTLPLTTADESEGS
ncbi:PAS domain S-box protein [Candidatus Bipolaricaulota bacterium]